MVGSYDVVRARGLDHGETLTLTRQEWVRVPPGFDELRGPLRPGVEGAYREDRPTDALAIRLRGDRVVVRRHRYHPRYHPGRHFLFDRLPAGVAAGLGRGSAGLRRVGAGLRRVGSGIGRARATLGRVGTALGGSV